MNWARIIPDGLLVFFPSYVVMAACIAHWKSASPAGGAAKTVDFAGTVWDRINKHKQAVVEPRVRCMPAWWMQQCESVDHSGAPMP